MCKKASWLDLSARAATFAPSTAEAATIELATTIATTHNNQHDHSGNSNNDDKNKKINH